MTVIPRKGGSFRVLRGGGDQHGMSGFGGDGRRFYDDEHGILRKYAGIGAG